MGLTAVVAGLAASRAHVLLVAVPGWERARLATLAAVAARGWVVADSPADADILLVCGEPGDRFAGLIDATWDQMPGPRARASITFTGDIEHALTAARASLLDENHQVTDARWRASTSAGHEGHRDESEPVGAHPGTGADMDMEMDMDMSGPGGIPLASGENDPDDGLEMDVLHLTLGPILSHWPAGLVLHCTVRGDIVDRAKVEFLPGIPPAESVPLLPHEHAAVLLDRAVDVLELSGWPTMAARLAGIRNELMTVGDDAAHVPPATAIGRIRRRLRRSRTWHWSLRGARRRSRTELQMAHDPADAVDRWLIEASVFIGDGSTARGEPIAPKPLSTVLEQLPGLVAGREFSAVRLLVASLGLETGRLDTGNRDVRERSHG